MSRLFQEQEEILARIRALVLEVGEGVVGLRDPQESEIWSTAIKAIVWVDSALENGYFSGHPDRENIEGELYRKRGLIETSVSNGILPNPRDPLFNDASEGLMILVRKKTEQIHKLRQFTEWE